MQRVASKARAIILPWSATRSLFLRLSRRSARRISSRLSLLTVCLVITRNLPFRPCHSPKLGRALVSSRVKLRIINPTHGSVVRHRDRSAWNGADSRTNDRRHQNCGLEAKWLCR